MALNSLRKRYFRVLLYLARTTPRIVFVLLGIVQIASVAGAVFGKLLLGETASCCTFEEVHVGCLLLPWHEISNKFVNSKAGHRSKQST